MPSCFQIYRLAYSEEISYIKTKEVPEMFKKKYYIYLTNEEQKIMVKSLIDLRNSLIRQGRFTDPVDEILLKIINL